MVISARRCERLYNVGVVAISQRHRNPGIVNGNKPVRVTSENSTKPIDLNGKRGVGITLSGPMSLSSTASLDSTTSNSPGVHSRKRLFRNTLVLISKRLRKTS